MKKILLRFSRVARTDFVKVSAWSAAATIIRMITGFVSVKVVAKIIGPPGMALVGQFMNAITIISTLGTGCINMGITKYIAEHFDEPNEQKKVISNAVRITLISTAAVSLLVIIFSVPLGYYIFNTYQYTSLIILFGASISLYSFNMLMVSILNGFKQYKKYVWVNIGNSIAGLALSLVLVTQFGLFGALLNCVTSQSVIIIVTLLYVYKEPWFRGMFRFIKIDRDILKKLGAFTLMALTSALVIPFTQLAIRGYITHHISLNSAGIWEGMNRLSSMYLLVITTSISTFYLPHLSGIKDNQLLQHEILKACKIVLPPLALACFAIFLCRDFLINLIFSKEFLPMSGLFAAQMAGDFFKILSWLLAFVLIAKSQVKTFIILEIGFSLTLVILSRLFINQFGLVGSVYAFCVNYIILFLIVLIILRKTILSAKT